MCNVVPYRSTVLNRNIHVHLTMFIPHVKPGHYHFWNWAFYLGSYHFLPGGGPSVCWGGGPEFFGVVKGGDQNFFGGSKGGTKIFWASRRGVPKFFLNKIFAPSAEFLLSYIIQQFFAPLPQSFSLSYFVPHDMFIYNEIFSQPPPHSLFSLITAPSIVCVRGMFFHLGGGGQIFFTRPKGGTKIFLHMQRRGPEQTDGPPPGKKL